MIRVLLVALFLVGHASFGIGHVFVSNLHSLVPDYGGSMGFLPQTGDADSPYDKFSNFLAGDAGPQVEELDKQGGLNFIRWAIFTPMCVMSTIVRVLLAAASFNYGLLTLLPTEGPGLWVRLIIHIVGIMLTANLLNQVVSFALRTGIFSQGWGVIGVLGVAAIGAASAIADGAGGLICP